MIKDGAYDAERARRGPGRPRTFDEITAIDRAVPVFLEKGYAAASVEDLTTAMGLTRPSLYLAFGDKAGLFLRCVDRIEATLGARLEDALGSGATIAEALRAFFTAVVENVTSPSYPPGCLLACTLSDAAFSSEAFSRRMARYMARADRQLAERLGSALAHREIDALPSAQERARLATALMFGIAVRARAGASRAELKTMARAATDAVLASGGGCL